MEKIQIKSEKLTSFGGIFPIMEKFDRMLSRTIDSTLGLRSKVYGYQYSEIIRCPSVFDCPAVRITTAGCFLAATGIRLMAANKMQINFFIF